MRRLSRPSFAFPPLSSPVKEGWLLKQSGLFKSWKPHWFRLLNSTLTYSPAPNTPQKGEIPIANAHQILLAPDCSRQPAFKIFCSDDRIRYFVCDSPAETQDWITALEKVRLSKPPRPKPRRIGIGDFDIIQIIGRGSYGKVQLVRYRANGTLYAMKTMNKQVLLDYKQVNQTMAEREVLLGSKSPFLVAALFTFQTDSSIFMVLDYVPGGELFERLRAERKFSENRARLYAAEIVLALGDLHSRGFIYRDLKPENILLDAEGHLKVTDFGLVKKLVEEGQMTSTFCGTPEYLAPEMVRKVPYTKSVDWWAFGSILYEMLVGVQPFYHQNQKRMFHAILNDPVVFSPKVSQNARDLIGKLLEKNPDRRLGSGPADFMEIQGHPFFASLDWNAVMNKWIIPEWKPIIKGDTDVSNFKQSSTATEKGQDWEQVDLIRDPSAQRAFAGFTFVNESRL